MPGRIGMSLPISLLCGTARYRAGRSYVLPPEVMCTTTWADSSGLLVPPSTAYRRNPTKSPLLNRFLREQFSGFCGCAKTAVSANKINCPAGLAADSWAAMGDAARIPSNIPNVISTTIEVDFFIGATLFHFLFSVQKFARPGHAPP